MSSLPVMGRGAAAAQPLANTYSVLATDHVFLWDGTTCKISSCCRYCKKDMRDITKTACPQRAEYNTKMQADEELPEAEKHKREIEEALWTYTPTTSKIFGTHRFDYDKHMRQVTSPCKFCKVAYHEIELVKCPTHEQMMAELNELRAQRGITTSRRRQREEKDEDQK